MASNPTEMPGTKPSTPKECSSCYATETPLSDVNSCSPIPGNRSLLPVTLRDLVHGTSFAASGSTSRINARKKTPSSSATAFSHLPGPLAPPARRLTFAATSSRAETLALLPRPRGKLPVRQYADARLPSFWSTSLLSRHATVISLPTQAELRGVTSNSLQSSTHRALQRRPPLHGRRFARSSPLLIARELDTVASRTPIAIARPPRAL